MNKKSTYLVTVSLISIILALIDVLIKLFIEKRFLLGESYNLLTNINITFLKNYGVAFSLFSHHSGWQLLFPITVAVLVTVYFLFFAYDKNDERVTKSQILFVTLILGGAWGNLFDRVYHGYVIDYISLFNFPVFNLADIFITLGFAGFFLNDLIFNKKQS